MLSFIYLLPAGANRIFRTDKFNHFCQTAVAHKAVRELPAKIEERNEKLKAEMMDNLRKLGNMCLKPFGLSTNNFKMEQNESGSYNIQFQQNP